MAGAGGGWRTARMVMCPRGGGESAVALRNRLAFDSEAELFPAAAAPWPPSSPPPPSSPHPRPPPPLRHAASASSFAPALESRPRREGTGKTGTVFVGFRQQSVLSPLCPNACLTFRSALLSLSAPVLLTCLHTPLHLTWVLLFVVPLDTQTSKHK